MAYDEALAARIEALPGDEAAVSQKRMFGGPAFLVNGNMAVAASGQGGGAPDSHLSEDQRPLSHRVGAPGG